MNFIEHIKDRIQGKAPKGAKRSPEWRKVRKAFAKENPTCYICAKRSIQVHHCIPFHVAPDLELEEKNLISFCPRCHLFVGHNGNFREINTTVKADARYWRTKFNNHKDD